MSKVLSTSQLCEDGNVTILFGQRTLQYREYPSNSALSLINRRKIELQKSWAKVSVWKSAATEQVFDDPTSLSEEELYELRNSWATCFLDLYNPEVDYDVADDEA